MKAISRLGLILLIAALASPPASASPTSTKTPAHPPKEMNSPREEYEKREADARKVERAAEDGDAPKIDKGEVSFITLACFVGVTVLAKRWRGIAAETSIAAGCASLGMTEGYLVHKHQLKKEQQSTLEKKDPLDFDPPVDLNANASSAQASSAAAK